MDIPTEESVHGHDVIAMIVESGRPWQRAELESKINLRWGSRAKFHTCSMEGMNASELIQFLAAHGKFIESDLGVTMDASKVCDHESPG